MTYALAIYHLNLLLAFLTPKIDPAYAEFEAAEAEAEGGADTDGMALPTRQSDEFRPFIRRLPEFKFWYSATKATLIAFFCTFFEFFNIPVFWPILVMYFITLFCITMKRQIKVSPTSLIVKWRKGSFCSIHLSAYDTISIHPVHLWKAKVPRQGTCGATQLRKKEAKRESRYLNFVVVLSIDSTCRSKECFRRLIAFKVLF